MQSLMGTPPSIQTQFGIPTINPTQQNLLDSLLTNPSAVTNNFASQLFAPGTANLMQNLLPQLQASFGASAGASSGLPQAQLQLGQKAALAQDQSIMQLLGTLFGGAEQSTVENLAEVMPSSPGLLSSLLSGPLGIAGGLGIFSGLKSLFGGSASGGGGTTFGT